MAGKPTLQFLFWSLTCLSTQIIWVVGLFEYLSTAGFREYYGFADERLRCSLGRRRQWWISYIFSSSSFIQKKKKIIEGILCVGYISRCKYRKYHDLFMWPPDNEQLGHLQCFAFTNTDTVNHILICGHWSSFARGSLRGWKWMIRSIHVCESEEHDVEPKPQNKHEQFAK